MFIGLSGGEARAKGAPEERRRGLFRRLVENLSSSRKALAQQISTIAFDPADDAAWERIEEGLMLADWACRAPSRSSGGWRQRRRAAHDRGPDGAAHDHRRAARRRSGARSRHGAPTVMMVVGVNGTGKTTTVGKLAEHAAPHGRAVVVAAADTFRAAAGEQLEIWAERSGADFVARSTAGTRPRSLTTQSRPARRAAATS